MKHVQTGKWLTTWHSAFWLQVPGHGSLHLFIMQALFETQSELTVHSGLQLSYGLPIYSGKQMQDPAPFCSLHIAFTPHGDGIHGFIYSWGIGSSKKVKFK